MRKPLNACREGEIGIGRTLFCNLQDLLSSMFVGRSLLKPWSPESKFLTSNSFTSLWLIIYSAVFDSTNGMLISQ